MLESVTLDQLRMLVAVADSGSFSAAARQVSRAQSAISQGHDHAGNTARRAIVRPIHSYTNVHK